MIECALILLVAVVAAAVTGLWAWHDHVASHPGTSARAGSVVEKAVDRWERTMIHLARKVPAMRHPVR